MSDFGDAIAFAWMLIVLAATIVLGLLLGVIAYLLGYPFWWGMAAALAIGAIVWWWSRT